MFNTADEDFLKNNLKDSSIADPFIRLTKKKKKTTIFILWSFGLVSCVALGYAFVQMSYSLKTYQELTTVQSQIDECIKEAQKQFNEAATAAKEAETKSKELSDQLTDCQNKIR